jgi:Protein of unknown function (DUF3311)
MFCRHSQILRVALYSPDSKVKPWHGRHARESRARCACHVSTKRTIMKKILLVVAVVVLYILHQDIWFWRTARPLVFGFVPIGLFYHAVFSVAAALLMWLLVKFAWPSHLEKEVEQQTSDEEASA